jgi:hypothetical protein
MNWQPNDQDVIDSRKRGSTHCYAIQLQMNWQPNDQDVIDQKEI